MGEIARDERSGKGGVTQKMDSHKAQCKFPTNLLSFEQAGPPSGDGFIDSLYYFKVLRSEGTQETFQ